METNSPERTGLEKILALHAARAPMYQAGVQTTVFGKTASNWQHWLTKLDFISKNESEPKVFVYEYPEAIIVRRLLSNDESSEWLSRLLAKNLLDTGHKSGDLQFQGRFSIGDDAWRGTIVFGVDDDHQVVGCSTQGLADTITNIIRSYCDPPPVFATTTVNHEGKSLLLLRVMESAGSVHTVKDQGPFIRANGTNRAPTSYELEILFRRRSSSNLLSSSLYGR